jgi:predicted metal-dependent enzyme (double-stranded beta helix superfamily)
VTTITTTHKSRGSLKSFQSVRRARPHSATERIPLPCAESCDGDPVVPPQAAERSTDCGWDETDINASAEMDRLVGRLSGLGSPNASPAMRARMLTVVKAVAERVDASACPGRRNGYARCVLHEDPAGWSLAAIVLRPGQSTPVHDHGGWGGAVTVNGVEQDRRFVSNAAGELELLAERDFPPGTGYLFSPDDVHQPVGADREEVTVALHFLASSDDGRAQHHSERSVAAASISDSGIQRAN